LGSFIKRHFGPTQRKQHTIYRFSITIPGSSGTAYSRAVNQALDENDLGEASVSGGSTQSIAGSGLQGSVTISGRVRDDWKRGLDLIRTALFQAQAPYGTTIRLRPPGEDTIRLHPPRDS